MSPSPFDSPDSLDIELWQSPPRRVKMRPWGAFDLLYNTVLFSVLLLVGVSGLAATVFARPFSWSLAAIGLLPALFFVLPSLLGLASHAHNVSRCRALVRSGKVRRARVESITLTTDKYPETHLRFGLARRSKRVGPNPSAPRNREMERFSRAASGAPSGL